VTYEENVKELAIQRAQGKIDQRRFVRQLITMLDQPNQYCLCFFEILSLSKQEGTQTLFHVLEHIFQNIDRYERKSGSYTFQFVYRDVHRFAIEASEPEIQQWLARFKTDRSPNVRAIVSDCLIEWGDKSAFHILENALINKNKVHHFIARTYAERVEYPLNDFQIKHISDAIRISGNFTRMDLFDICYKSKDVRFIPILSEMLDIFEIPSHKWGDLDAISYQAAAILETFEHPQTQQVLSDWRDRETKRLREEFQKRRGYYYAGKLGDKRLLPDLIYIFENTDNSEKYYVLGAITKFDDPSVIETLLQFLKQWQPTQQIVKTKKGKRLSEYQQSMMQGYPLVKDSMKSLGARKSVEAVPVIVDIMLMDHPESEKESILQHGTFALLSIGNDEAQQALQLFKV
jgi:hypothetical protein